MINYFAFPGVRLSPNDEAQLTPYHIMSIAAKVSGIEEDILISHTRKRWVLYWRNAAIYICCMHTGAFLKDIGKAFGGRDHATIINSRNNVRNSLHIPGSNEQQKEIYASLYREVFGVSDGWYSTTLKTKNR